MIVAAGVLIGAALLRRYAEWHGISDDHIRGLLGWITITGFIGAHWLDTFAYEPQKLHEAIPQIGKHETAIVMHNDAVVQGLSEASFMTDVTHWGVVTIGTGLGNARFTNRLAAGKD